MQDAGKDNIIKGKVTKITNFGAFVQLPDGKTGLVHISEVSHEFVKQIEDHISEGDEVAVKVLGVDKDGRISLSIKKAMKRPEGSGFRSGPAAPSAPSFEDMLSKFKTSSEDKFRDINRRKESRSGGGHKGSSAHM